MEAVQNGVVSALCHCFFSLQEPRFCPQNSLFRLSTPVPRRGPRYIGRMGMSSSPLLLFVVLCCCALIAADASDPRSDRHEQLLAAKVRSNE